MIKLSFANIVCALENEKLLDKNFDFAIINENKNLFISSSTINSNDKKDNSIFFAINGKNVNGIKFLLDAKNNGAKYFLVERKNWENRAEIFKSDILEKIENLENIIISNNPEKVFLCLAKIFLYLAEKEAIKTNGTFKKIIITGSTGKTTTKNFLFFTLKNIFGEDKIFASEKNLNNCLGVPLNIFKLQGKEKICIFEVGISKTKEMDVLANIIKPDIGIILNIGPSHLEFLKNLKGVCDAKWELVKHIKKNGKLFLNISDFYKKENVLLEKLKQNMYFLDKNKIKLFLFGNQKDIKNKNNKKEKIANYIKYLIKNENCILGKIEKLDDKNFYKNNILEQKIKIFLKNKMSIFTTKILENAGLNSILVVLFVSKILNINIFSKKFKNIIYNFDNSYDSCEKQGMRFSINKKNDIFFINDAYNANPMSMENSLKILSKLDPDKKNKIIILGDMLELGSNEKIFHENLAKDILKVNFKKILLIGEKIEYTFLYIKENLNKNCFFTKFNEIKNFNYYDHEKFIQKNIFYFENIERALIFLKNNYLFSKNDIVLLKGSRKMKLEKILDICH